MCVYYRWYIIYVCMVVQYMRSNRMKMSQLVVMPFPVHFRWYPSFLWDYFPLCLYIHKCTSIRVVCIIHSIKTQYNALSTWKIIIMLYTIWCTYSCRQYSYINITNTRIVRQVYQEQHNKSGSFEVKAF